MENEVALELNSVRKSFGNVVAVDGISAQFGRGEYFCILGPSGCGKTTLLRLIAGFEAPDAGTIRLHGRDLVRLPPELRDVNVVFQSYALFPHLNVSDNIAFGLRMKKTADEIVVERVEHMLKLMHLEGEARRRPNQLSGGQQQRVALARALVNRPAVLLLDEPLGALDESLRQHMQQELHRLQRETHVTFVHVTHDQSEALALADRIGVMRAGRFEQVGTPREIYQRPATGFVATFVGATNMIDAELIDLTHVSVLGTPFTVARVATEFTGGGPVTVAVRPESVAITTDPQDGGIPARIVTASFAGPVIHVTAAHAKGAMVRARVPSSMNLVVGQDVFLSIDPVAISVLPRQRRVAT